MGKHAVLKIRQALFRGLLLWAVLAASGPAVGDDRLPEAEERTEAFLYYAVARGTHLTAVSRAFPPEKDAHTLGRAMLEALMEGPAESGLKRLFPQGTRINALFVTGNGEAYVDIGLDRPDLPPGDTMTEYLRIYSLVNTLTVNIPEIRQVKILVNGDETSSLGGHISLDTLFKTNMLIVK